MIFCNNCGKFSAGNTEHENVMPEIRGIQRGAQLEYQVCSGCGSDNVEEAGMCRMCGDYIQEGALDLCDACYRHIMGGYLNMLQGLMSEHGIGKDEALYGMSDVFEKFYEWKL